MTDTGDTYYVIGSGPSGVTCALALLKQGKRVVMIDVGRSCEPEKLDIVNQLRGVEPELWDTDLLERTKNIFRNDDFDLPVKLLYGSDFPYAFDALKEISQNETKCLMSFARGGLSNVWGGAMLPNTREDFEDWPVSYEEMSSHYAAVASFVHIAGSHDAIEGLFPFYHTPLAPPVLSNQARLLLDRMGRYSEKLAVDGIYFGQSRLALNTRDGSDSGSCRYTGLCLTGCPYLAIYNATQTLDELLKHSNFSYKNGLKAVKVVERSRKEVTLHCKTLDGKESFEFTGKRVFIACGVLATLQLVLNSVAQMPQSALKILYQPYFMLPVVMGLNSLNVEKERLHTLSQLFIEISDHKITNDIIHLQVYTYNHFIKAKLSSMLGVLPDSCSQFIQKLLVGRLLLIQGYLNSKTADGIDVSIEISTHSDNPVKLNLSAPPHLKAIKSIIRKVSFKLLKNSNYIGAYPIIPMLKIGVPGYGNHIGGSLPMRDRPKAFESDIYGRVAGMNRIHVVDGSVLPTIPASTITYTIMANAHRIGQTSADLD